MTRLEFENLKPGDMVYYSFPKPDKEYVLVCEILSHNRGVIDSTVLFASMDTSFCTGNLCIFGASNAEFMDLIE